MKFYMLALSLALVQSVRITNTEQALSLSQGYEQALSLVNDDLTI